MVTDDVVETNLEAAVLIVRRAMVWPTPLLAITTPAVVSP